MTLQSKIDTTPLKLPPEFQKRRAMILTLLIGMLIGIFLSVLGTVILFNTGFFDQFYICPAPVCEEVCPQDETMVPICVTPTMNATDAMKSIELTPSPTASATPDIGATATSACGTFESQFPGTPCPSSSNP